MPADPEWKFEDAWLLASSVIASRVDRADLAGVLFAADYLNHHVPTQDELNRSFGRLRMQGLVEPDNPLTPTSEGSNLWTQASNDRFALEGVHFLRGLLNQRSNQELTFANWEISEAQYVYAERLYRQRFSEALGRIDEHVETRAAIQLPSVEVDSLHDESKPVDQVVVAYELSRKELLPILRWQVLHNRTNYRWFFFPGCACLLIGAVLSSQNSLSEQGSSLLIVSLVLLGRFFAMVLWTPTLAWRKGTALHQRLILRFAPDGVRIWTARSNSFVGWSNYSDLIDVNSMRMLKLRGRKAFLYIPKQSFRSQADERLLTELAKNADVATRKASSVFF